MKGRKRILIAYASAGSGHQKAADAIEGALAQFNRGDIEIKKIDTLDYARPIFKKGYIGLYLFLVNKIPRLWGLGYYLFDTRLVYRAIVKPIRQINNFLYCGALIDLLKKYRPDVVINTHFLGSEVMAGMKRRGFLKDTTLITVVTDYFMHSFWVDAATDYYCVAQQESKRHLMKRGIPQERIRVFGIPIDMKFALHQEKSRLCATLDVRHDIHTVLIGSGGFGVGPVKTLVREIAGIKDVQLLVVCGYNAELKDDINAFVEASGLPIKVYGFVDNMDELMEIADVIVTKSGGMTSSEAMSKGLPMVIIAAIPGQEARNCRYLVKAGAAIEAANVNKAKEAVRKLLESPQEIERLRNNIRQIKKPNAAYDIARFALTVAGGVSSPSNML